MDLTVDRRCAFPILEDIFERRLGLSLLPARRSCLCLFTFGDFFKFVHQRSRLTKVPGNTLGDISRLLNESNALSYLGLLVTGCE